MTRGNLLLFNQDQILVCEELIHLLRQWLINVESAQHELCRLLSAIESSLPAARADAVTRRSFVFEIFPASSGLMPAKLG
jgi:hypothetical protein